MAWTEDRVATLTKLWADGLSASQIAKQLGGVTRNAVIGKVHRLGLSGRAKPSSPARKAAAAKTAANAPKASARATVATTATAETKSKPKPVRAPSAPRTPRVIAEISTPPAPLDAKPMSNGEFATILTITDHMCKWPIGDPSTNNFRFCGRKTDPEEPYCLAHSRVAYQPSRRRGASSNTKALGPQPTSRKRLK